MLVEEIQFFTESLAKWLETYQGKVALVKGRQLIGTYDTETQALAEGARLYQTQPFLIRRILPSQPEVRVPALTLGIPMTNANFEFIDGWPAAIA